ncbi:FAD-dependent monooxygenase [Microbulbifer rhizosphaerae]|uniref:Ubiquinone biosynthesis UbiH/UbiF/VisC/COQ6 family hydroxylase n=1 Tax=Microbulbifer rhizosphaerae TaxID=1562603 RepID=A0A7W4Z9W7_9GAMM|nr:ubiquinone biosynthesis UbiH/UbiF/VisC/COQ6 family hydroxylase [Microbulbifer rhizosphaerae]
MVKTVDIAIVGGGMAGASLALLLQKFCPQLSVALLERQPLPLPTAGTAPQLPSFDTRATAVAAGSLQIFSELGLWPRLRDYCAPIERVQVSDRGRGLGAILEADPRKRASFAGMLGAVIENAALGPVLYDALAQTDAQLLAPAQVRAVTMESGGAQLSWRAEEGGSERTLQAGLLVVADGVDSPLCHQLNIGVQRVEYRQRALITTVGLQRDHGGVAYERFTERGPMALLPLPRRDGQHRVALVWTCADEEAEQIASLEAGAFVERLQRAFGWRAGRILRAGKVHSYPLSLSLAEEQWRRGLVLVGNCAHFLHPVAGQGFNLTLRDCHALALTLARGCAAGAPPGELDLLQEYGRERRLDQQLTIGFSDRVPSLFASGSLWARGLRQAGLLGLTLAPPLRAGFVGQAAGFGL